ncbi:branched-chain amino acid ABC transporter permease [Tistrella bauzanensis]|uniref:Branched-chain amino acid ABC transporter permease n=1 Tax=Tistrella arctica TaxID=3133430 RepID=A0ABU9YPH7_9PROT
MRIGDAKTSYIADEQILDTPVRRGWFMGLLVLIAVFPLIGNDYTIYLACLVAINVISATGLNILTGFTGQISLGQAAFMGLGGYTVAVLASRWGVPFIATLPMAGLASAAFGVLVGLPSLRVKGLYLAIATLAASVILHFVFAHWDPVTGGIGGISIPPASLFGYVLDNDRDMYWLIMALAVLACMGARNLFRTRVGRAFIAIRDRDISAEVLGIDLLRWKLYAFALSSFYAGVAGGLFAYFFRVVTPESFPLTMSIFFLAAIIVGGMGTIMGGILGAIFMTLVPEALRFITSAVTPFYPQAPVVLSPMREVVFGLLIVLFLIFEPHGLAEMWRRLRRFFHLWPFRT